MEIPDEIVETAITLKDQFFDLRGLSVYSCLGVGTLRDYIRAGRLPCFKLRGKIVVKRSEFDSWIEQYRHRKSQNLDVIVDGVMDELKS